MKKWFYRILLGILIPLLGLVVVNPSMFRLNDSWKALAFILVFSFLSAMLLIGLTKLFYKLESYKLNRIRDYFDGQLLSNEVVKFRIGDTEVYCNLTRTSELNNRSYLEFHVLRDKVKKEVRRKITFLSPSRILRRKCFKFHKSYGFFIKKLERELLLKLKKLN